MTRGPGRGRKHESPMKLDRTLRFVSLASILTTAAAAQAQSLTNRDQKSSPSGSFRSFLSRVEAESDPLARTSLVGRFIDSLISLRHAHIEDSTVYLLYRGKAGRVTVPSDLNGWNPSADSMTRVAGTDLFYLSKTLDQRARFEYKFYVDSTWILDPLNLQQAMGGHGPNSEVWMPLYSPPPEIEYRSTVPHGTVDTISFESALLGRIHPVFIYKPPGYKGSRKSYPVIYVTDGGEYISLALMLNVLDNLIAENRLEPVVGIFVDPRTDVRDPGTSRRMTDYAMSDTFVNALITELRPRLMNKYRLASDPAETAILGASLGGLIATYAAMTHPEVFGLCAAQSPSYWWNNDAVIHLAETTPRKPVRFYIDTGTIRDAEEKAHRMSQVLESKGYRVMYGEYPEGHNWVNWRARLATLLTYFWGKD